MKTNSRKPKRPAEAKTSRTAKRKGDYVQRRVRQLDAKTEAMIKDSTTSMTRDILTGYHDSPAQIRKAIRQFEKDKRAGKIKPSEERL